VPHRLRKELFAFNDNKIAVQFWYEFYNESDKCWYRCYGLGMAGSHSLQSSTESHALSEDWTFNADGRMEKRQMSGNNIRIAEQERWYKDGMTDEDVDALHIDPEHW
jgi:nuclear transport factor 2 (NTF2) superfamily protein